MSRSYRARHHKYFGVVDARDQVLERHQQAGGVGGDASRVASAAVQEAAARTMPLPVPAGIRVQDSVLVEIPAEVVGPPMHANVIEWVEDQMLQAMNAAHRSSTAPFHAELAKTVETPATPPTPTEKPYEPIRQPGRRVATLPAGTTYTQDMLVQPARFAGVLTSEGFVPAAADDPRARPQELRMMPVRVIVGEDQLIADEIDQMIAAPVVEVPPTGPAPLADATLADLPIGHHTYEYLSGTAGTGKTTLAKKLDELAKPGSIEIAATTGIAAVNLGEGTTIHALLGFFDMASLTENYISGRLHAQIRRHKKAGLRRILIDEVSMMDGRMLTMITRAVDEVNGGGDLEKFGEDYDEFEGGEDANTDDLALTLVGDFAQLSPVPGEDTRTGVKIPAQYAFESAEWHRYADHVTKLEKIWRQSDRDFIEALHAVRRGDGRSALAFFSANKFSDFTDDAFEGSTVVAKNVEVDRVNGLRLDRLPTPWMEAKATRWGKQRGDWSQVPDTLRLKEQALVMVLANERDMDTRQIIYANGDLGTLVGQETKDQAWLVKLKRTGQVVKVHAVTRENTIPLQPGRRKELIAADQSHLITKDKKREIVGTISYIPLRCAFACTVHKTQGLTLDSVQVNLRDPFFKHPGMLFVALSRARTAAGLRIVGNQVAFFERCRVDPRVVPWL